MNLSIVTLLKALPQMLKALVTIAQHCNNIQTNIQTNVQTKRTGDRFTK